MKKEAEKEVVTEETEIQTATSAQIAGINTKLLSLIITLNLVITFSCIYCYDHFFVQKVAVLDVNKYISHLKELYINGKISDKELNDAPKKIKTAIDSVSRNTTILIGEAVLQNGKYIEIKD